MTKSHAVSIFGAPGLQFQCLHGVVMDPTDTGNGLMGKLGSSFRRWCKNKRKDIPPFTWNLHLIGRGESDKRNYPELDSNVKASHTKPLLFFLADLLHKTSQICA